MLDAKTGEIVALANWPTFNPNNRTRAAKDKMRNRALTDTFEPGSSMKPFTIAAALDSGKVTPATIIDTAPGTLTISGATIHDAHREGARSAGHSEIERRRREDRVVATAIDDVADAVGRRLRHAAPTDSPVKSAAGCVRRRAGGRSNRRRSPMDGISVNLLQSRAYTVFARR
jgi:cell division protein FtsI (penicillin-binding protein 3)